MDIKVHAYTLIPNDRIEQGIVLSVLSYSFTTILLVMDKEGEWSILDYPGDTIFLLK